MNTQVVSDYERAFEAPDTTSEAMRENIRLWFDLYFGTGQAREAEMDASHRIPCVIVEGLDKACFGEYAYSVEGEEQNAAFAAALGNLDLRRHEAFQMALIGGEGFLKPIPRGDTFSFSFVRRDAYIVLARDAEGRITSVGTSEKMTEGGFFYTLLEKRTVETNGVLSVENKLFRSEDRAAMGEQVGLGALKQCARLKARAEMPAPDGGLGLVQVKTPMANCVDGSKDGVSVYAAAAGEILNAYRLARRTGDEYELTAPHLIASADVQRRDRYGRVLEIPKYIEAIDDDPERVGLTVYNPTPNQAQLEARENQLLRHIEDICGLQRGMLSHVDNEDKTATEVLASSGRYALTIRDFQAMWATACAEVVRLMVVLGPLYGFWAGEAPRVTLNWGNGVLYDEDRDYQRLRQAVAEGGVRQEYLPAWIFDEKLETPEDFVRVRERYMPTAQKTRDGHAE